MSNCNYQTRLKRLDRENDSSLFGRSVGNDGQKSFMTFSTDPFDNGFQEWKLCPPIFNIILLGAGGYLAVACVYDFLLTFTAIKAVILRL